MAGGRRRDPCWDHATEIPDPNNPNKRKWRCNHCESDFAGGASRIKVHLGFEKGEGIHPCKKYRRGQVADEAPQQGNTSARPHPLVADSGNTLRSLDQSNPISVSPQGALDTIPPRHPELRDQDSISNQHINSAPTIHQVATDLQTLNLVGHNAMIQGDIDVNRTCLPMDMTRGYAVTGLAADTSNAQGFTYDWSSSIDTNISDGRVNAKTLELHDVLLDVPVIRSLEPDGLLERTQMGRSANCRPNAGAVPVGAVTQQNTQHSTDPQAPIQLRRRPTFSETQTSATSHDSSSYLKYINLEAYSLHSEGCVPDADATAPEIQSAHSCGTQIVRSTDFLQDADLAHVNQQDIQHSTAGIDPSVETWGYGHAGNSRAGDIPRNNIVPEQPNHLEPMHIDTEAINPSTRAIPSLQLNVRDEVHDASNSATHQPIMRTSDVPTTEDNTVNYEPEYVEEACEVTHNVSNQIGGASFDQNNYWSDGMQIPQTNLSPENAGGAPLISFSQEKLCRGGFSSDLSLTTSQVNRIVEGPSQQNTAYIHENNIMSEQPNHLEPTRDIPSFQLEAGMSFQFQDVIPPSMAALAESQVSSFIRDQNIENGNLEILRNSNLDVQLLEEARPNALYHAGLNVPPTNTGDIHENMMLEHNEPMQVEREFVNARESPQPSSSSSSVTMESRRREIFELAPHTVGRDQIVDEICHSLTDQILCIGVYGMGGVGKTTIMKRLHDKVRGDAAFGKVLWVTVSQDCSLQELQNKLSMALKVADDFRTIDIVMRPTFLNEHLRQRGKTLIILDDLWQHYDLKELGIKLMRDGDIQLVLTTRDCGVCRSMMCEKELEVGLLPDDDAMNLFERTLEYEISPSRKLIAEGIVRKCRGLPLAIVLMAKGMREVDSDHGWNCTLEKLGHPEAQVEPNMQKGVFPVLYHSYSCLYEKNKDCFRLCALRRRILRGELIELFIDEGVICKDSRRKMYDEGHHILDELEKKSLLEKVVLENENRHTDEEKEVTMHDVMHDLALHVMNSEQRLCMVKCSSGSNEIPCEDGWSRDLQKVSLVDNSFMKELPSLQSNCPKLSTLLVSGCYNLSEIPECFFERAEGLKVVDISSTAIATVPGSIIKLKILNALILSGCRKLLSVPSLATLKSLRKLDLGGCELIDAVPDGVEMLVNLTYLDLSWTGIKEITAGVVGKLQKLQYLGLGRVAVHGKEVAALKKLEIMCCRFKEMNELSDYMQHRQHESTLKAYTLLIGDDNNTDWNYCIKTATWVWEDPKFLWRWDMKVVILERGNSAGETLHIPSDVTALSINCDGEISCTNTNFNQLENLETLTIQNCRELLRAVLYRSRLTKLKRLHIDTCEELKSITCLTEEGQVEEPQVLLPAGKFTQLQSIGIFMCPKMRHVVGPELLPRLHNLHRIDIRYCDNMEEVIGMPYGPPPLANTPILPLLTAISIGKCPKMRHVVGPELLPRLHNLHRIDIWGCDNMEEVIGMPSEPLPLANTPFLPLLTTIGIRECPKMRHVVGPELLPHLHHLRSIDIWRCDNMEEVIGMPYGPPPLSNIPILPLLTTVTIWECPTMRRLLTLELFTHLPNLERIHVSYCGGMKEVIGTESEHGIGTISNKDACMLPPPSLSSRKPLSIRLDTLTELESINNWPHIRSFIRRIDIRECPKLKRIPFLDGFPSAPPFLENLVIDSYQQWESMEWEHPQAKHALEPSVFIGKFYNGGIPIKEWRLEHLHPPVIEEEATAANHFPTSS